MDDKELRQDRKYVWYGALGFAGPDDDLPFSGQVSYSPAEGIHIKILTEDSTLLDSDKLLVRGKMHALLSDEHGFRQLTLFNVFLNSYSTNFRATELRGTAEMLVDQWVHDTTGIQGIKTEYSRSFEDFMFWRSSRDRSVIELSKLEPFITRTNWKISLSDNSTGTSLRDENDLDTVFWTRDPDAMTELKAISAGLFKKHSGQFLKRKNIRFYVSFEHPNEVLGSYLSKLGQWEDFIEFLIDDTITPMSTQIIFKDDKTWKKRPTRRANAIFGYVKHSRPKRKESAHHFRLPINFSVFGEEEKYGFAELCKAFEKWTKICESSDWKPIYRSIKRSLKFDEYFGDTPQFASSFSDISAFLSLTDGSSRGLPDEMITKYASEDWKYAVRKLFPYAKKDNDLSKFLGEELKAIRNSIEHPADDEKRGRTFHRALREDEFKLHLINAYVTGLLMQGVLSYLGIENELVKDKFLNNFVEAHGNFRPIIFDN